MRTILIFTLLLTACDKNEPGPMPPSIPHKIAEIPLGCERMISPRTNQPSRGYHAFKPSLEVLMSDAYDCGIREGMRCTYFVHNPDGTNPNFLYDTHCVEL